MSKLLLATKAIGGGLAGTGIVVVGGVCMDRYIKSKEIAAETTDSVASNNSEDLSTRTNNSESRDTQNLNQDDSSSVLSSTPKEPSPTVSEVSQSGEVIQGQISGEQRSS